MSYLGGQGTGHSYTSDCLALLKKPSLDTDSPSCYCPVSDSLFLAYLDAIIFLDPCQYGFHLGYGTESVVVDLVDDPSAGDQQGKLCLADLTQSFSSV